MCICSYCVQLFALQAAFGEHVMLTVWLQHARCQSRFLGACLSVFWVFWFVLTCHLGQLPVHEQQLLLSYVVERVVVVLWYLKVMQLLMHAWRIVLSCMHVSAKHLV
jgi:hypothetical protein